jgi:ribosomal protein L7/L12
MVSDTSRAATTPAGWYDDGSGQLRWWDGVRWTEHVAPRVQTSESVNYGADTQSHEDRAALRKLAREQKAAEAAEAAARRTAKLEKSRADAPARKLAKDAEAQARAADREARVRENGLDAAAAAERDEAKKESSAAGIEFRGRGWSATVADSILTLTATGRASRRAIGDRARPVAASEITALEFVPAANGLDVGTIHVATSEGRFALGFHKREGAAAASWFEAIRTMAPDAAIGAQDIPLYRAEQKRIERVQEAQQKSIQQAERAKRVKEAREAKARAVPIDKAWERALKENAELDRGKEFERTLETHLSAAQEAAATGNIRGEEARLIVAVDAARGFGGRKEVRDVEQKINSLSAQGRLRIGSALLGTVEPEGKLDQYQRKGKMSLVHGGKRAIIRSDRVLHDGHAYPIDEYTAAQVYLDGMKQITQRPTLTRMALLSPLPGSALVPGLALQKKETNDLRTAEFQITGRGWNVTVPIHPDKLSGPRSLAEQINMLVLERRAHSGDTGTDLEGHSVDHGTARDQEVATPNPTSILDELTKLQALVDSGMITPEEASTLKAGLMSPTKGDANREAVGAALAAVPSIYTLTLVDAGPKKIEVIKTVRQLTGLGLADAKRIVDSAPSAILSDIGENSAETGAEALRAAGAIVELLKHQ